MSRLFDMAGSVHLQLITVWFSHVPEEDWQERQAQKAKRAKYMICSIPVLFGCFT